MWVAVIRANSSPSYAPSVSQMRLGYERGEHEA